MAAYARCSRDSMQVAAAPVLMNDRYPLAEPEDIAKGQPLFPQVKPQRDSTRKSRKPRKYRKLEGRDFAPDPTVAEWAGLTFQIPAIDPTQKLATTLSSLHHKRKPRPQRDLAGNSSRNPRASKSSRPSHQTSPNAPESQHKKGRRRGNKGKKMEPVKAAATYSTPPHLRGKVSCPPGSSKLNRAETAQTLNRTSNTAPSDKNNSTSNQDICTTPSEYIPPHRRGKVSHLPTFNVSVTAPAQTTNSTSNAASSRENSTTPGQHNNGPKATISNDETIASRRNSTEIATTQKGFAKGAFSTPHQQTSAAKASSSSCLPTRTMNGHRPQSLPSPPSSPMDDENEEPTTGTLGDWRGGWKELTSEQSKRVSFDASNSSQSRGIQQSKWANKGRSQKEPSPNIFVPKAVQQPEQDKSGCGESNETSFNQSTLNTVQQPNQIDNGGGDSCQASSTQSVHNAAQQSSTNKKASKTPNFTWNDPWDPKQANELKGANRWQKKGKTHWPKNSEMKAQPAEEDESDGGVSFKSNSNGDPDYDVKKLMDWSGNWMPPPEVWTSRNTFRDRHFGDSIEGWMERAEAYGTSKLIMEINTADFLADIGCDLVPRDWIPTQIEGDAPQQFWRSLPSRAPAPVDDLDLEELKPWWESYKNPITKYLSPFHVPDALIDPEDDDNKKHTRVPQTSQSAINKMKAKQEADYRKTMARRNRPIVVSKLTNVPAPPDLSLKPTANIYLRPAQPADIPKLTDLYNHYVRETISANEFNDRTPAHMAGRLQDVTTGGLPWIVAVKKGNHSKNQHYKFVNEEIVGFANIDDYCDQGSMYRYTMEMEMFVHPEYLRQGIGKCLLDRMLELVDNGYRARGGYEWTCNGAYLKSGATRIIKTVNLHFLHEHGITSEVNWVAAFLKSFDFRKGGHLHNMGFKLGKTVDVTIFQYTTSEPIDAKARPHAPL